jgi:hypothetical protein
VSTASQDTDGAHNDVPVSELPNARSGIGEEEVQNPDFEQHKRRSHSPGRRLKGFVIAVKAWLLT